jgi:hypothetical protein
VHRGRRIFRRPKKGTTTKLRTIFLDDTLRWLCWAPPGQVELIRDAENSHLISSFVELWLGENDNLHLAFSDRDPLTLKVEDEGEHDMLQSGLKELVRARKDMVNGDIIQ